jgi:hypothetical protein
MDLTFHSLSGAAARSDSVHGSVLQGNTYFQSGLVTIRVYWSDANNQKGNEMVCSAPRRSDEERARAALEQMDDTALALIVVMVEDVARKNPRLSPVKAASVELVSTQPPKP